MKRLTDFEKEEIKRLNSLGKMDSEIASELNITSSCVWNFRKRNNIPTKFTYSKISKIDNSKFEELFKKGLSDYAIAKELGMSSDGVYSHRKRHGYERPSLAINKEIKLSEYQNQVLIGTLLGDASLRLSKMSKNPTFSCAHGIKQMEYCKHKEDIFKTIGVKGKYHKRNVMDKRTGLFYEDYTITSPANPAFLKWYNSFYVNNKKVIPFNLLDHFTEVSLAFLYMDDGSKTERGYSIATNCFTELEISKFRAFLLEKFNLDTSMFKGHQIYIKSKSAKHFTELISPYVIDSMKYKLHSVSQLRESGKA